MKSLVRVNEPGMRIGESHHKAKLTDNDVRRLLDDRHVGGMSLQAIADKWGMSKSGVKMIVDGSRRGQVGPKVAKKPTEVSAPKRVRVKLTIGLYHRAKLARLGGRVWLENMLDQVK